MLPQQRHSTTSTSPTGYPRREISTASTSLVRRLRSRLLLGLVDCALILPCATVWAGLCEASAGHSRDPAGRPWTLLSGRLCMGRFARTGATLDYLMVESRGGHGEHSYGQYDVFRPLHRWIWVGADASGLIREIAGPYSFYTPAGKARWEAAGSPPLREGLHDDVFRPGRLRGTASQLAARRDDPAAAPAVLAHDRLVLCMT